MKNKMKLVLAALLALTMAFALAGCGKPSLQDWYNKNQSEFQEIEDSVNAQSASMGCTLKLYVEDGNALVFAYTLLDDYAVDTSVDGALDSLASIYDSMFDQQTATFSELRTEVLKETSTEDVIIRLIALNPDGTELYSRDFTE